MRNLRTPRYGARQGLVLYDFGVVIFIAAIVVIVGGAIWLALSKPFGAHGTQDIFAGHYQFNPLLRADFKTLRADQMPAARGAHVSGTGQAYTPSGERFSPYVEDGSDILSELYPDFSGTDEDRAGRIRRVHQAECLWVATGETINLGWETVAADLTYRDGDEQKPCQDALLGSCTHSHPYRRPTDNDGNPTFVCKPGDGPVSSASPKWLQTVLDGDANKIRLIRCPRPTGAPVSGDRGLGAPAGRNECLGPIEFDPEDSGDCTIIDLGGNGCAGATKHANYPFCQPQCPMQAAAGDNTYLMRIDIPGPGGTNPLIKTFGPVVRGVSGAGSASSRIAREMSSYGPNPDDQPEGIAANRVEFFWQVADGSPPWLWRENFSPTVIINSVRFFVRDASTGDAREVKPRVMLVLRAPDDRRVVFDCGLPDDGAPLDESNCTPLASHNPAYARLCVLGETPAADCPDRLLWTARFIRGETLGEEATAEQRASAVFDGEVPFIEFQLRSLGSTVDRLAEALVELARIEPPVHSFSRWELPDATSIPAGGAQEREAPEVALGETRSFRFTLRKIAPIPVEFVSLNVFGANASDFAATITGATPHRPLDDPSGAYPVDVSFSPSERGWRRAEIHIAVRSRQRLRTLIARVSGFGGERGLEVAADGQPVETLDFDMTLFSGAPGDAGHSRPISVRNSGNLNARVHGLSITGPQAAEFQVIDPGATGSGGQSIGYGRFGRALTPGQSFGATVRFRPPTTPAGTRQAMLKVRSSVGDFFVALTARPNIWARAATVIGLRDPRHPIRVNGP